MAELATDMSTVVFPLDPLSADEVRRVVGVLRRDRDVDARWRFASVELCEPPKGLLHRGIARAARVVCWDRDENATFEAFVSIDEAVSSRAGRVRGRDRVLSWRPAQASRPAPRSTRTGNAMRCCAPTHGSQAIWATRKTRSHWPQACVSGEPIRRRFRNPTGRTCMDPAGLHPR